MRIQASQAGSVTVVAPAGRIDHEHAVGFQQALEPYIAACTRDGAPLLLDLAGVEYISSVGLRALMLFSRAVQVQHGRIAIAALQPAVHEVFAISRFNLVFDIHDSVAAGVAALQA